MPALAFLLLLAALALTGCLERAEDWCGEPAADTLPDIPDDVPDDANVDSLALLDVPGDTEDTDETCADGLDNDDDGFTDCEDFSCSKNASVTVCP